MRGHELLRDAAGGAAIVLMLLVAGVAGFVRACKLEPDFLHWDEESAALLRRGTIPSNTSLYGYLPGSVVVMAQVFGRLPTLAAAALLALTSIGAALLAGWAVQRLWIAPWRDRAEPVSPASDDGSPSPAALPVAAEAAGNAVDDDPPPLDRWGAWNRTLWRGCGGPAIALCAVQVWDPITAGQFSLILLACLAVGVGLVLRGRDFAGGMLIAAATAVKPPGGLLMAWAVWKGRPLTAVGWLAGMVLFTGLPAVLFFGFGRAVDEQFAWLERASRHGHGVAIDHPLHYRRNQSLSAMAGRWLRALPAEPEHVLLRGDPPPARMAELEARRAAGELSWSRTPVDPEGPHAPWWEMRTVELRRFGRLSVADLSPSTVRVVWGLVVAGFAAALLWSTRGGLSGTKPSRAAAEAAVWCVAIFWFSPYLYHNYFVWALPAVAMTWVGITRRVASGAGLPWAGVAGLAAWVGAELLRGQGWGEFWGVNQVAGWVLAWGVLRTWPR